MSTLSPTAAKFLQLAQKCNTPARRHRGKYEDYTPAIEHHIKQGHELIWICAWLLQQLKLSHAPRSAEWYRYYNFIRRVNVRYQKSMKAMEEQN